MKHKSINCHIRELYDKDLLFKEIDDSNELLMAKAKLAYLLQEINVNQNDFELTCRPNDNPDFIIAFVSIATLNGGINNVASFRNHANSDKYEEGYESKSGHNVFNALALCETFVEPTEIVAFENSDTINYGENTNPIPIITIGILDVMSHARGQQYDASENELAYHTQNIYDKMFFDARYRFLDSSIWFRYLPLGENFQQRLTKAIKDIHYYYQNNIYNTNISRNFLEFQLRLLFNSYVGRENKKGQHATHVTPFKFHSESQMQKRSIKFYNKIKHLSWNFLVIDDKAKISIERNSDAPSKLEIIEGLLKNIENGEGFHIEKKEIEFDENKVLKPEKDKDNSNIIAKRNKPTVYLYYTTSIEKAKIAIEDKDIYYDIVLLDYLFNTEGEQPAYGYELIQMLKEDLSDESQKELRGPLSKMTIFPISVYANAMRDAITDLGYSHKNWYWHISGGADPVNTPEHFKFKIIDVMHQQLDDAAKIKTIEEDEFPKPRILAYLQDIMGDEPSNHGEEKQEVFGVKFQARQKFPDFVRLGELLERFNNYKDKSRFAQTVMHYHFFDFDTFAWDHFQNLVYLLKHGTFLQRDDMWEEYTLLVEVIDRKIRHQQNNIVNIENRTTKEAENQLLKSLNDFKTSLEKLGKYIVDLK